MALTNEDKNWIKDVVIDSIAPLVKDLNEFKELQNKRWEEQMEFNKNHNH